MSLNLRHRPGLTLVEILVVMAIFSILATMLFTVFRGGIDAWRKMETHLDVYQNARIALEQMTQEISQAFLDQSSSDITKWASFYGNDEGGARIKTNSAKDEVFFVAPVENAGDMDLCEIGYWLDGKGTADTSDDVLMRHFQKFDSPDDLPIRYDFTNADSDDALAANVKNLQFRYYYRSAAFAAPTAIANSWNATQNLLTNYDAQGSEKNPDGLPNAVEITLTMQTKDGIETKTFTTLVAIEAAR